MSKDWGYFCKDCQEESDTWFNHGEEKLFQYFSARQLLKNKGFHQIEIEPLGGKWAVCEMEEFLKTHKGHNICLVSEYGEFEEFQSINDPPTSSARTSKRSCTEVPQGKTCRHS